MNERKQPQFMDFLIKNPCGNGFHDYEIITHGGRQIGRKCKNCTASDNVICLDKETKTFVYAGART